MKFLVQKIDKKIVYDFAFELIQAQNYYKWRGGNFEIKYANLTVPDNLKHGEDYIPVGSVEFVTEFVEKYLPGSVDALRPLNVPECLFPFAGRLIINVIRPSDIGLFSDKVFAKSNRVLKDENNGLVNIKAHDPIYFVGQQVSDIVFDICSEWRVFVHKNEIQHIANYSGDCTEFPNISAIKAMVEAYEKDSPIAYTLDVAVTESHKTIVIECHRFFSCGLYGFCDYAKLPIMFSQEWFEIKNILDK